MKIFPSDTAAESASSITRPQPSGSLPRSDFLAGGVSLGPVARLAYRVIVRAAYALVDPPERRLLGAPRPSWRDRAALYVARLFAATVRAVLAPAAPQVVESPPSTAST